MSQAVWTIGRIDESLRVLTEVAKSAELVCQYLDTHEEAVYGWGADARKAHEGLHSSLEPYERLKYGEES